MRAGMASCGALYWPRLLVLLGSLPWLTCMTYADDNDGLLTISASATTVRVGDSVRLQCDLQPGPQPQPPAANITWYKVAVGDGDGGAQPQLIAANVAAVNGTVSFLALANVTASDGGRYSCCPGKACSSPAEIEIRVGYPPEPVTDLKCDTFNFISVTCQWTRGGQSSLLPSDDTLLMSQNKPSGELNPCVVPNPLLCNATRCQQVCGAIVKVVYYRINTTNALGSAVSQPLRFKLYKNGTLNPPANLTVRNVSSNKLALRWFLPDGYVLQKVSDLSYTVESRYEGSTVWIKAIEMDARRGVRDTVYNVTGLEHPYGLYFVRVMAVIGPYSKTSRYSDVVSARTTETVPENSPQNVHCKDSPNDNSTRNVILTWEAPASLSGATLGYDVSYRPVDHSASQQFQTESNITSSIVNGLDKHKEYVFNVRVRNSMGTSHKESCTVSALPMVLPTGFIAAIWVSVILVVALLLVVLVCVKSTRKFPNINLPRHEDLDGPVPASANTFMGREAEVYDDILPPHHKLFVDLPEVPNGGPPFANNLFLDGFDIGNKPGEFRVELPPLEFERQPLLAVAGADGGRGLARGPFLAGQEEEELAAAAAAAAAAAGDASPGSPVSVGSGGSYAHIRSGDKVVYSRLSQERLSPVIRDDGQAPQLRDEQPAAASSINGLPTLHLLPEGSGRGRGKDLPQGKGFDKRTLPLPGGKTAPDKKHGGPQLGFTSQQDQGKPVDGSTGFAIGDYSLCGLEGGTGFADDRIGPADDFNRLQPVEEIGPYVQTTGTLPHSSQAILDSMNALPRPARGGLDYVPHGEDGYRPDRVGSGPALGDRMTGYVPPADVMRGGAYPREAPSVAAARPNEIGPYVLSTGELPPAALPTSWDPLWSPASAARASPPSPSSPPGGWPTPMADEFGLGELNYATLCADLDSEDGLGVAEPSQVNGYALMQGAAPNTADAGDSARLSPTASGYVDQDQPSQWGPASLPLSPETRRQEEEPAADRPTNGFLNGGEASAISPHGPEDSPVDNGVPNYSGRPIPAASESAASDYVAAAAAAAEKRTDRSRAPDPLSNGSETNGYASNSTDDGLDYVNPDSLAALPQQSPKLSGRQDPNPQGTNSDGNSEPNPTSR